MQKALIQGTRIAELVPQGQEFEVGGMIWVDAPDSVTALYTFVDGVFILPAKTPELSYDVLRLQHYPAIGDQLDAIWKFIAKRENNGVVIESDVTAILQNVEAVKAQFPKPR